MGSVQYAEAIETGPVEVTFKKPQDGRCHSRRPCPSLQAQVQSGPWYRRTTQTVTLKNIGVSGACVELPSGASLTPGSQIKVFFEIPVGSDIPDMPAGKYQVDSYVAWTEAGPPAQFGIRFDRLITDPPPSTTLRLFKISLVFTALLLMGVLGSMKVYNIRWYWYNPGLHSYSLAVSLFIITRIFVSLFYKEPKDRGYLPSASIVIAARNEGAHIGETIENCFGVHYPPHLLEVIAIDDGSTDGTWEALKAMRTKYPQLRLFRFGENQGKRPAMALGAEKATGEILIYIDSDSSVEPEGVYRIVQPFADPQIGAVAGHIFVKLDTSNFISKMESARYFISHRIMKAAESLFGVVTCCSGAFSAYRRSAVMEILQPWLHQKFLGATATFGDDRSLTNFILRKYNVIFHNSARAWTYVPNTWSWYFKQQLRWKKSWARETVVASRIMYRKHPLAAIPYYIGVMLTLMAPIVVFRNMVFMPLVYSQSFLPYLTGLVMVYLLLSVIYLYHNPSKYWYYGVAFAVIYISVLSWQNYYAIATVSRTHWGTR